MQRHRNKLFWPEQKALANPRSELYLIFTQGQSWKKYICKEDPEIPPDRAILQLRFSPNSAVYRHRSREIQRYGRPAIVGGRRK